MNSKKLTLSKIETKITETLNEHQFLRTYVLTVIDNVNDFNEKCLDMMKIFKLMYDCRYSFIKPSKWEMKYRLAKDTKLTLEEAFNPGVSNTKLEKLPYDHEKLFNAFIAPELSFINKNDDPSIDKELWENNYLLLEDKVARLISENTLLKKWVDIRINDVDFKNNFLDMMCLLNLYRSIEEEQRDYIKFKFEYDISKFKTCDRLEDLIRVFATATGKMGAPY